MRTSGRGLMVAMAEWIPVCASRIITASWVTTLVSGSIKWEISGDGILMMLRWWEPVRGRRVWDSAGDVWVVMMRMVT